MAAPDIDASPFRGAGVLPALWLVFVLTGSAFGQALSPPSEAPTTANQSEAGTVTLAGPGTDPTANVLALTDAATKRQDDLREASERFLLMMLDAAEKREQQLFDTGAALRAAESRRVDELNAAESKRIDDLVLLRADFQAQLSEAEAKRIDAIRTVDVNAVAVANQRAVEQANVLAQQVASSAETLRALVASTEQSVAASQEQSNSALASRIDQQNAALTTRIAALEQAQYVGQGRSAINDPAFTELQAKIDQLTAAQNTGAGQSTGSSETWQFIFAGLGALAVLLGFIAFIRKPAPVVVNGNGKVA